MVANVLSGTNPDAVEAICSSMKAPCRQKQKRGWIGVELGKNPLLLHVPQGPAVTCQPCSSLGSMVRASLDAELRDRLLPAVCRQEPDWDSAKIKSHLLSSVKP